MKRKLLVLAVLVGICAFNVAAHPPLTSFPLCNHADCVRQGDSPCICPAGTPKAGQLLSCLDWMADCNNL
jgi:hypothetical protein